MLLPDETVVLRSYRVLSSLEAGEMISGMSVHILLLTHARTHLHLINHQGRDKAAG